MYLVAPDPTIRDLVDSAKNYYSPPTCGKHEYLNDQNKCVHKNDPVGLMKDPPEKSDALGFLSSIFG